MAEKTHSHAEHILPLRVYFGVFGALLALTALTVYIAGFHFGPFNLVVAMVVAAVKASLVALIFMHLKYDNKVFLLIFLTSIAFLAIFITFTMADTLTRGDVDPQKARPIVPQAVIYRDSTGRAGLDTDTAGGSGAEAANPTATPLETQAVDSTVVPEGAGQDTVPVDVSKPDTTRPPTSPDTH